MAQQITDAEIEERTHLLELVKISTEVFSRQQYERLKELSNKMFASAGSPHIAKENTKHMAQQTEQMTSVEWLENNMPDISHYVPMKVTLELHAKFQEAERMHEMQIIDAYKHGQKNEFSHVMVGKILITGEEYYEQTFTTQAQ